MDSKISGLCSTSSIVHERLATSTSTHRFLPEEHLSSHRAHIQIATLSVPGPYLDEHCTSHLRLIPSSCRSLFSRLGLLPLPLFPRSGPRRCADGVSSILNSRRRHYFGRTRHLPFVVDTLHRILYWVEIPLNDVTLTCLTTELLYVLATSKYPHPSTFTHVVAKSRSRARRRVNGTSNASHRRFQPRPHGGFVFSTIAGIIYWRIRERLECGEFGECQRKKPLALA